MLSPISPHWPAPPGVVALATTRQGGVSTAPFDSLNLGLHVGDGPRAVHVNRQRLATRLGPAITPVWLEQVHGTKVVEARGGVAPARADALFSREPGVACCVLTADCLPVLFCSARGDCVAAAHAGWRGLAAGVLEATVDAIGIPGARLLAWLGPAIGPGAFEVGAEVRQAFVERAEGRGRFLTERCFRPLAHRDGQYLADLYQLARLRLSRVGVTAVYGGGLCTVADAARFYSYRRDGTTGRMVSLVALAPVSFLVARLLHRGPTRGSPGATAAGTLAVTLLPVVAVSRSLFYHPDLLRVAPSLVAVACLTVLASHGVAVLGALRGGGARRARLTG